jgi:hypothetical protein
MTEGWDGGGGFEGDGTWQTIEYRQGGFKTSKEASDHLDIELAKYGSYTISDPNIRKTSGGWEVHFSGYKRT